MKTDDMISLLAANVAPLDPKAPGRRFRWSLVVGSVGSVLLMLLVFGARPDISTMLVTPMFWAKVAFPIVLSAAALVTVGRLSRPGISVGHGWHLVAAPLLLLWLAATATLMLAPGTERLPMVLGATWRTCALNIGLLSIPVFIAAIRAVRELAPTRLRTAGAAAGLLAGAIATTVYCLHCPEMGVSFWAVWYVAGMGIPVGLGAWLGPWLLRW